MYAALLRGPHEILAEHELLNLTSAGESKRKGRVLLFDCEHVEQSRHAALTHFTGNLISSGRLSEIYKSSPPWVSGSFRVRCIKVPGSLPVDVPSIERNYGAFVLENSDKAYVNLEAPETEIKIILTEKGFYSLFLLFESDSTYLERTPHSRPFFHPPSLNPQLCRLMLNLSKGKKILDPFCGSGGILIEGSYLGKEMHGIDFQKNVVSGAKKNLEFYSLPGEVKHGKAEEADLIFKSRFDSIVTDPPYGKSSRITEDFESLMRKCMPSFKLSLKKGGRLVIATHKHIDEIIKDHFDIIFKYDMPVHNSLTRKIYVAENE